MPGRAEELDQAGHIRRKAGGIGFSFNLDIPSILNGIFHLHKEMYSPTSLEP